MNNNEVLTDKKEEELILQTEAFLYGEKNPVANKAEYDALVENVEEFLDDYQKNHWSNNPYDEMYHKSRLLKRMYSQLCLLEDIYSHLKKWDIDESAAVIKFKKQNEPERNLAEEFQTHIAEEFKMHIKCAFDSENVNKKFLKNQVAISGQVESGILGTHDTVLINGKEYSISSILKDSSEIVDYAGPGMEITVWLKNARKKDFMPGLLVKKK